MATKRTLSAKRNFCVWADYVRRVYQHVEARSPKAAYAIAKRQPECWEPCDWHDNNGYRLSNEVQDLATEEFTPIYGAKNCRTCGSEIVETINESNFRDGECGPCEYQRYRSQAALLKACEGVCGMIYRDKNNDERVDLDQYEQAELACRKAIGKAKNNAA